MAQRTALKFRKSEETVKHTQTASITDAQQCDGQQWAVFSPGMLDGQIMSNEDVLKSTGNLKQLNPILNSRSVYSSSFVWSRI